MDRRSFLAVIAAVLCGSSLWTKWTAGKYFWVADFYHGKASSGRQPHWRYRIVPLNAQGQPLDERYARLGDMVCHKGNLFPLDEYVPVGRGFAHKSVLGVSGGNSNLDPCPIYWQASSREVLYAGLDRT